MFHHFSSLLPPLLPRMYFLQNSVPSWKQLADRCTNWGWTYTEYRPWGRGALLILGDSKLDWTRLCAALSKLTCSEQRVGLETSRGPFQPELLYNPRGKEHSTVRICLGYSQGNDLWQERDTSKRQAHVHHWNKAPPFSSFPSQLPPTPPHYHSISSQQVSTGKGPSVLRTAIWNVTKCRFWSKHPQLSPTHPTIRTSTLSPLFWMWDFRALVNSVWHSPTFILKHMEILYSILSTFFFFLPYLLKGIKELFCFRSRGR